MHSLGPFWSQTVLARSVFKCFDRSIDGQRELHVESVKGQGTLWGYTTSPYLFHEMTLLFFNSLQIAHA